MKDVIEVRFRTNGKIYYFDPKDFNVPLGSYVIVETARGMEYGRVVLERRTLQDDKVPQDLKAIVRLANPDDKKQYESNKEKSKKAFEICAKKIKEHGLEMKLISAEYTFDNSKVLFYFTADGRIDFRLLVRDLASVFRTRIELRQVGVRDETKLAGGLGMCGRELCCHSYLSEFIPVSIKMAKEQSLSLNPTKISGACGRLMCCLKYEEETYEYLNSQLPNMGDTVTAFDGISGEVVNVNVLRQSVKIIVTDEEGNKDVKEYKVSELKFRPKKRKRNNDRGRNNKQNAAMDADEAELKRLEALERQEEKSKLSD